jgi:hypothetical protein
MRHLPLLGLLLIAAPAVAAPIATFDDPKALLEAIYDQIASYEENWEDFDPDASFDDRQAFSDGLSALLEEADRIVKADDSEMGALDFSPFINGQDSGGMAFTIGEPKVKGDRATAEVEITLLGESHQTIGFELVDEGRDGWKIDDIILPPFENGLPLRLSDYLADPLAP